MTVVGKCYFSFQRHGINLFSRECIFILIFSSDGDVFYGFCMLCKSRNSFGPNRPMFLLLSISTTKALQELVIVRCFHTLPHGPCSGMSYSLFMKLTTSKQSVANL